MTSNSRPTPESYRESLNARHRLVLMNLHRKLAERCENESRPSLRREYAQRYRELIGVEPEERKLLQDAMFRIVEGGGATVEEVIERIRIQSKRLTSDGRES